MKSEKTVETFGPGRTLVLIGLIILAMRFFTQHNEEQDKYFLILGLSVLICGIAIVTWTRVRS